MPSLSVTSSNQTGPSSSASPAPAPDRRHPEEAATKSNSATKQSQRMRGLGVFDIDEKRMKKERGDYSGEEKGGARAENEGPGPEGPVETPKPRQRGSRGRGFVFSPVNRAWVFRPALQ